MKKKTTASKDAAATKAKNSVPVRKLGDNRGEASVRQPKRDKNFKQSRDVRESRGVRQVKASPKNQQKRG